MYWPLPAAGRLLVVVLIARALRVRGYDASMPGGPGPAPQALAGGDARAWGLRCRFGSATVPPLGATHMEGGGRLPKLLRTGCVCYALTNGGSRRAGIGWTEGVGGRVRGITRERGGSTSKAGRLQRVIARN